MKSFEDWYNEYGGSSLEEGTARASWKQSRKEALEWVLRSDPQEGTVFDMIEEELAKER